jgi:hypothetical protein
MNTCFACRFWGSGDCATKDSNDPACVGFADKHIQPEPIPLTRVCGNCSLRSTLDCPLWRGPRGDNFAACELFAVGTA